MEDYTAGDPYILALLVAGFLYSAGYQVSMSDAAMSRATPAAGDLLRAFGITPMNKQII